MAYSAVAGQVGDALALGEDLGSHSVALALVEPSALAHGDAGGILSTLIRASASSQIFAECLGE